MIPPWAAAERVTFETHPGRTLDLLLFENVDNVGREGAMGEGDERAK
jgi:hypothetical protein